MLCQANARYDDVDRFPVEIHNRMQSPPGKEFYSSFLRGASRDRAKHIPNNGLLNLKISPFVTMRDKRAEFPQPIHFCNFRDFFRNNELEVPKVLKVLI